MTNVVPFRHRPINWDLLTLQHSHPLGLKCKKCDGAAWHVRLSQSADGTFTIGGFICATAGCDGLEVLKAAKGKPTPQFSEVIEP